MTQNNNLGDFFDAEPSGTESSGSPAPNPHEQQRVRPRNRKKKMSAGKWVISGLLALVLLGVAAIGGYYLYVKSLWDNGSQKIEAASVFGETPPPDPKEEGKGTNILLLGSDARATDVDYTSARGFRSDTILVAHIPADNSGIYIVSIPRDSWVDIEGHGKAKINAAMSYGGLPLATKTMSQFIGAPIHHVAIIDFEGFQGLSTALGGVDVTAEQAFSSNGSSFDAGINTVEGKRALDFVRARKNFKDGDYTRMRHQQEFLKGVVRKTLSGDTLSDPGKITNIVKEFSPYVTVDDGLSSNRLVRMGLDLRSLRASDMHFFTAPNDGPGRAGNASIIKVDQEELKKMQDAFANDEVAQFAETAKNGVW